MPIDDKTPEPENLHTMHLPNVHVAVPTHARVPWQVFARELLEDVMADEKAPDEATMRSARELMVTTTGKVSIVAIDEVRDLRKRVDAIEAMMTKGFGEILATLHRMKP